MSTGRPSIGQTFLFFAAVVLYLLGVGRIWDALVDRFNARTTYPPAPNAGWGDLDTPEDLRLELGERARRNKR